MPYDRLESLGVPIPSGELVTLRFSGTAGQPSGGVCDGNNIAACGVPVVDTMGVRGGKIHSMEEFLIVESLPERAALSALTILRLAGGAA